VGLRGGYRWNYGKYEVAAYCSNCLNQIRLVGGIDFDNLTGFINDPVIAGVQFSGKF
jgi:iron complex outermembrane receptor protein